MTRWRRCVARGCRAARCAEPIRAAGNGAPGARPGSRRAVRRRQRVPDRPARRRRPGRRPRAASTGTARGGRITKADVLAAAGHGVGRRLRPRRRRATLIKGGGAALARYMDESRSIPTATSFRTLTVTTLDARRKQLKDAGQKVSFTHLIAYAIAEAATDEMPVMAHHFAEIDGKPYRVDDGAVNLGLAVDVEKKDGTRTLMVPVIRDAGRLELRASSSTPTTRSSRRRATNTLTADDLTGGNITLTNPGGIGTVASVPRLMVGQGTIVATGSIAYPVGLERDRRADRRREGHDDDLDLRPPRSSRAPSPGRFLQRDRGVLLQGEDGFYEAVFGDLGVELPALPPPTPRLGLGRRRRPPRTAAPAAAAAAAAPPTRSCCRRSRRRPRCSRPTARTATWPRSSTRSAASPRATRRWIPRPLGLTPELMARIPAAILRMYVPGDDARRGAAASARDLLRHDRLRDRAHRLAPAAAVAARGDRVRHLPPAADRRGAEARCSSG